MNQHKNQQHNNLLKKKLRKQIRTLRKNLTPQQQLHAAEQLCQRILTCIKTRQANKVALFCSMDGEINTQMAIEALWHNNVAVYLPVIHPFNPHALLFIKYDATTPMKRSSLGMLEPLVECHQICPLAQLDILFTPLVAFDDTGNRLGMGGGFYDRTLERLDSNKTAVIGLAHDCQKVSSIPTEPWDISLKQIITPSKLYEFV